MPRAHQHPSLNKSWVTNNMYENMHTNTHPSLVDLCSPDARCHDARRSSLRFRFWSVSNLISTLTSPDDTKLDKSTIRDAMNGSAALLTRTELVCSHREQSQFEGGVWGGGIPHLLLQTSDNVAANPRARGRPFVRAAPFALDSICVQRGIPKTIARWSIGAIEEKKDLIVN